jgi:hypothetical protein
MKTARIRFQDPGRLTSRSVTLSAFAVLETHGRVRMAYTWPWPQSRFARNSVFPLSTA